MMYPHPLRLQMWYKSYQVWYRRLPSSHNLWFLVSSAWPSKRSLSEQRCPPFSLWSVCGRLGAAFGAGLEVTPTPPPSAAPAGRTRASCALATPPLTCLVFDWDLRCVLLKVPRLPWVQGYSNSGPQVFLRNDHARRRQCAWQTSCLPSLHAA